MSFPRFRLLLLADLIRPEADSKLTILGFLGIAPLVEVRYSDFNVPLAISFLLVGEPGSERHNFRAEIIGPDERKLINSKAEEGLLEPAGPENQMATVVMVTLKYPGPGTYKFQVISNDEIQFEETFRLASKPS